MNLKVILSVLILKLFRSTSCEDENEIMSIPGLDSATKTFLPILLNKINSGNVLGLVLNGYEHKDVSLECQLALGNLSEGINNGNLNAAKFVDASAKIDSGMAEGTIALFGSFDECLDADYPSKRDSMFRGKYCSIDFEPDKEILSKLAKKMNTKPPKRFEISARWDICLPSSCNEKDIEVSLRNSFRKKFIPSNVMVLKTDVCQTRDVEEFSQAQIVAIVILGFLGAILITGTLLDVLNRIIVAFSDIPFIEEVEKQGSLTREVLISFSMYTNILKLLDTEVGVDKLNSLNGVRFLSITWIVLCHCYYYVDMRLVGNLLRIRKFPDDVEFHIIINGSLAVDSFLLLSGVLVTYVVMKEQRRSGGLNWGVFYLHRFWRLTPGYGAVTLFAILLPLLGSGPVWPDSVLNTASNCETKWWMNLLYINNLYNADEVCLTHSWYLSIDTQFYVVSPIILFFLYKKPLLGLFLNFAFMVTSISTTAYLAYVNEYPPTPSAAYIDDDSTQERYEEYYRTVYLSPFCRMGPYCVGIFVGYFLTGQRKLNLSSITKSLLWCLSATLNLSIIFGTYEWNRGNLSGPLFTHVLYFSTFRTAFAIGIAWVIIACCTENGGIVNSFLSWKLFVPLGRLTFMVYLVHPLIIMILSGTQRGRDVYVEYIHVVRFLGVLTMSVIFALLASLAAEAPFLRLEKVLLNKLRPKMVAKDTYQCGVNETFNSEL